MHQGHRLLARGELLLIFFPDEVGVGGRHEALEVFLGRHDRLNEDPFEDAPHVVQRDEVVGVDHGQRQPVVDERDRQKLVLSQHLLGQELQHARVELEFAEVDVLDSGLLVGLFQALGEDAAERQADFGTLEEQVLELLLFEHATHRRLRGEDRGGARLPGQQGHLSEAGTRPEFCEQEVDPCVGAVHEKHRVAGTAFLDDGLEGSELSGFQPAFHHQALVIGERAEKFDFLEVVRPAGNGLGLRLGFLRRGRNRKLFDGPRSGGDGSRSCCAGRAARRGRSRHRRCGRRGSRGVHRRR